MAWSNKGKEKTAEYSAVVPGLLKLERSEFERRFGKHENGVINDDEKALILEYFSGNSYSIKEISQNVLLNNPDLVIGFFERNPGSFGRYELEHYEAIPIQFFTEDNASELERIYKNQFKVAHKNIADKPEVSSEYKKQREAGLIRDAKEFKGALDKKKEDCALADENGVVRTELQNPEDLLNEVFERTE